MKLLLYTSYLNTIKPRTVNSKQQMVKYKESRIKKLGKSIYHKTRYYLHYYKLYPYDFTQIKKAQKDKRDKRDKREKKGQKCAKRKVDEYIVKDEENKDNILNDDYTDDWRVDWNNIWNDTYTDIGTGTDTWIDTINMVNTDTEDLPIDISSNLSSPPAKKQKTKDPKQLILHFDINGTIIAYDSTDDITKEQQTNMLMAKHMYGTVINGQWIVNKNPYTASGVTYHEFLKTFTDDYDEYSYKFTSKGYPGEHLQKEYKRFLNVGNDLFASFKNVLEKYEGAKIILRTFGVDGEEVAGMIPYDFRTCYMGWNWQKSLPILQVKSINGEGDMHYYGYSDIQNFIRGSSRDLLIVDNYDYWKYHSKDKNCGKPFVYDKRCDQIFFDDNDCVDARYSDGTVCNKWVSKKVNTLRAMTEENYYTDYIKMYLERHSE